MNKIGLILALIILSGTFMVTAQHRPVSFFESNGIITRSPELNSDLSYTVAHLDHRADDIVWAHVVYSIIDLRDISNSQLAFPISPDVQYKNLFRLICDAVVAKTPVYYPNERDISPYFAPTNKILPERLTDVFYIETNVAGAQYIDPLFEFNQADSSLTVSMRIYDRFANAIQRFLVQKVYFFDKHLSTMGSKVIAIAPIQSAPEPSPLSIFDEEDETTDDGTLVLRNTLRESIIGWFLYDDLKPHFSAQPVYQESNAAQRVSYHEYFTKRMYSDYMIGDNNLFKRLYGNTDQLTISDLKSEIKRISRELVEIESDIWAK